MIDAIILSLLGGFVVYFLIGAVVSFTRYVILNLPDDYWMNWPMLLNPWRNTRKAYNEGYSDMKHYGSIENPKRGRGDDRFMNHKSDRIFNAYIKGGDAYLDELFEDKLGTSKRKVRESMLDSRDKARIEAVKAIEEINLDWQSQYDRLEASAKSQPKSLVGRKNKNVRSR